MEYKHECTAANAPKFWEWIQSRGGVAVWSSINLSNPDASWSTPAKAESGEPTSKPTWQADNTPKLIVTDPNEIKVVEPREVKRFHVAVRVGSHGMSLKVTDGGSRRIRAAVVKAGKDAWYEFDYSTQEAVILVPGEESKSLLDWARENGLKPVDVLVTNEGTVATLEPLTDEAKAWIESNVGSEAWQWMGNRLCGEPRLVEDVISGMLADGLEVKVAKVVMR